MIAVQIARILANTSFFLGLDEEETIEANQALEMQEWLTYAVDELPEPFLRGLIAAFAVIAPEYKDEAQKSVRGLAHELKGTLAADDPARLAELEAERKAWDD